MSRNTVKAPRKRTEREKLDLFLERCDVLGSLDLVKNGFGYNHTVNWSRAVTLRSTFEEPPEKELRAILGELRKFVAPDSDIYLNRIHGIVYRHLRNAPETDTYKEGLKTMNRHWKDSFQTGFARLTINGTHVSPEHAWNAWINGHYLHDDMGYRAELKPLDGVFKEMHRVQFLEGMIVTLKYIHWLATNIYFFQNTNLLDLPP